MSEMSKEPVPESESKWCAILEYIVDDNGNEQLYGRIGSYCSLDIAQRRLKEDIKDGIPWEFYVAETTDLDCISVFPSSHMNSFYSEFIWRICHDPHFDVPIKSYFFGYDAAPPAPTQSLKRVCNEDESASKRLRLAEAGEYNFNTFVTACTEGNTGYIVACLDEFRRELDRDCDSCINKVLSCMLATMNSPSSLEICKELDKLIPQCLEKHTLNTFLQEIEKSGNQNAFAWAHARYYYIE